MAYHVSIKVFEGPLDLLLSLISKAQIDIKDIFVSEITNQFMEYVSLMHDEDMDRASSFVQMAARLLEIKSARLLPRAEEDEPTEEEAEFIRMLEEYRAYKELCARLEGMQQNMARRYTRLPVEFIQKTELLIEESDAQALMRALQKALKKIEMGEEPQERVIRRDTFSVKEKLYFIRSRIASAGRVDFSALFEGQTTREEVVVTFLALLELVKTGVLGIEQNAFEGEITLYSKKGDGQNG